ncbi:MULTISPECIES: hypothetical protein [Solirubrobacterales]|uniref:Uncharacterized protein n=1 Tax=Paraconexibacter algicola TaxID=2133960 RepID=A0A2T4UKH3_9ACTN|nr:MULTISPECIES: hypothetical protein [Solirubrobacterales]PTL59743.1 hypothetical protein C7Y72_08790 [Paraconexibacter algicola]
MRALLLPLLALAASVGLIAVHLASGGDDFVPRSPADPCVERPLRPAAQVDDLEPLVEELVVLGVARAACTLRVPRERLVLALPVARDRRAIADDATLARALKGGLARTLDRLERGDRLPRASALRDAYSDQLGLPGLAEEAVRRIPDGVVDDLLPTGAVLRRALDDLDVLAVIREIDEPDALERRLRDGIERAARAEARERLIGKLPGPLRSLLGLG